MLMFRLALLSSLIATGAQAAEPAHLLSARRTVAQGMEAGLRFVGLTDAGLRHPIFTDRSLSCADLFRRDVIEIWSETTQSRWFLLAPRRLGKARDPAGV